MHYKFIKIDQVRDERGLLTYTELNQKSNLPFAVERVFVLSELSGHARGEHAHIECEQLILCLSGSFKICLDDGITRQESIIFADGRGLYVPKMTWTSLSNFCRNTIILVFASQEYLESDYIRDYKVFLNFKRCKDPPNNGST